ncbi:MAG: hypothetical protein OK454_01090 [Thaumarchaeota archaeon]|nr:hypothetical protein [Nitrososphaerota archaeon]
MGEAAKEKGYDFLSMLEESGYVLEGTPEGVKRKIVWEADGRPYEFGLDPSRVRAPQGIHSGRELTR